MLSALVIVFREVLEAGLIVGIVLAATQGVKGSRLWVAGGLAAGLAGSVGVAFFTDAIASALSGIGQEILNASILATAVLMLASHNIWMATHGRELARQMRATGEDVLRGRKPLAALAIVVGLAVLREGSEVALFLYGAAIAGGVSAASMLTGGLLGLAAGGAVSGATYAGLLRVPSRHLFAVTSFLITFLAAGMAAQAVFYLEQAGVVSLLSATAWDSSWLLPQDSMMGAALHALLGYAEQPSWLQVVVYAAVVIAITGLMRGLGGHQPKPAPAPRPAAE